MEQVEALIVMIGRMALPTKWNRFRRLPRISAPLACRSGSNALVRNNRLAGSAAVCQKCQVNGRSRSIVAAPSPIEIRDQQYLPLSPATHISCQHYPSTLMREEGAHVVSNVSAPAITLWDLSTVLIAAPCIRCNYVSLLDHAHIFGLAAATTQSLHSELAPMAFALLGNCSELCGTGRVVSLVEGQ